MWKISPQIFAMFYGVLLRAPMKITSFLLF